MGKETAQNIKLGAFVTLGLVFLALALYLVGNQRSMFSTRFRLSTQFAEVNGLREGNNVRFAGIDVGTIERVSIVSDAIIRVDMLIREDIQSHIKKDAIATIGTDGLVGNVIVNIRAGSGNSPSVEANDWILSQPNVDTDALLKTLSVSSQNVAALTQNLVEITDQINRGQGSLGILLRDDQLGEQLQQTIANLSRASTGAAATVGELQRTAQRINHGPGIIGFLAEDTVTVSQLQQTMQHLQSASERIADITQDIQQMVQGVEAGQGTAGLLISDSVLAGEVQQRIEEVETGLLLFNENMQALRHNFLLRRYFKKQQRQQPE